MSFDKASVIMSSQLRCQSYLPEATSSFLDALRVIAALTVFLVHCLLLWYGYSTNQYGQDAVVIFFVLSGYVIAYSTFSKHHSIKDYTIARAARLYSVVVPALILTFILQFLGNKIHPALYQTLDRGHESIRYVLNILFLQEVWKFSANPASNGPLWSLGYEFWYYALFGAMALIPKNSWKIGTLLLMALMVGPKVLILMPIWLLGVALFIYGRRIVLKPVWARLGFTASVFIFAASIIFLPAYPYRTGFPPLYFSGSFVTNWILGIVVAMMIWLFHQSFSESQIPQTAKAVLKWGAGHTFSLYLYHFPLLVFAMALLPFNFRNPVHAVAAVASILCVILLLSTFTEARRGLWYSAFSKSWDALAKLGKNSHLSHVNVDSTPSIKPVNHQVDTSMK